MQMEQYKKRIAKLENEIIPDNTILVLEVKPDPVDPAKWYKLENGKKTELTRPPLIKGIPEIKVHLIN